MSHPVPFLWELYMNVNLMEISPIVAISINLRYTEFEIKITC